MPTYEAAIKVFSSRCKNEDIEDAISRALGESWTFGAVEILSLKKVK